MLPFCGEGAFQTGYMKPAFQSIKIVPFVRYREEPFIFRVKCRNDTKKFALVVPAWLLLWGKLSLFPPRGRRVDRQVRGKVNKYCPLKRLETKLSKLYSRVIYDI